jgi:hypothetical protein
MSDFGSDFDDNPISPNLSCLTTHLPDRVFTSENHEKDSENHEKDSEKDSEEDSFDWGFDQDIY